MTGHCKIIADVGSNWFELDDLLESIELCTADIFKIQHISSKKLYGKPSVKLVKEIPETWIPEIWNACKARGMGFMCSVFDDMDVTFISQFVDYHKIASAEITDENLLTAVADAGKHTLISTGMATEKEIRRALSFFQKDQVTLLYCESEYPSRSHWLGNIGLLTLKYNVPVGYSDHSLDIYQAPNNAINSWQVTFLEKHYGLERILRNRLTPDHPHSLNEHQFKAMVEFLRNNTYKRVIDTTHRRIQKGDRWVRPV
jgi:sialic acid synthase SpsE